MTSGGGLPAGYVLADKYRVDHVLGRGSMGVVVAARDPRDHEVAIKILLPSAAERGDAPARLLREARATMSLKSEHVVRVSEVGTLDNGLPYLVMERLVGADLKELLAQRGPLPVKEVIGYVLQACDAIAEAHSLGLVHRDLKPSNLFLTTRADGSPLVKVLDFGLSKATKKDAADASLTASHLIMGSPLYMSPEQVRSFKTIDERTDVWSMGVILYELLGGQCPWLSESLGELFLAIGMEPAPPLRDRRPDLPEPLEATIFKCLEKDPAARMQTIPELARALRVFA